MKATCAASEVNSAWRFRSSDLGSARFQRAVRRILRRNRVLQMECVRQDAGPYTQDACAPQKRIAARLARPVHQFCSDIVNQGESDGADF